MYMKDLDEYTEEQLEQELRRRFNQRAQGRCDYCGQLKTAPSCKFHKRHNAPEKFEHLMTLREQLASWCHDQWIHWMTYLFEKGDFGPENEFTIEPESVARWQRQMRTPYMKLSEAEKGSDLEQAGKLLYLLRHELSFSLVGMHFGAKDAMSMKAVLDTVYELSKSLQVGNNPKLVGQTLDVVFGGLVEEHNALTELLDKHAVPEIFEGVDAPGLAGRVLCHLDALERDYNETLEQLRAQVLTLKALSEEALSNGLAVSGQLAKRMERICWQRDELKAKLGQLELLADERKKALDKVYDLEEVEDKPPVLLNLEAQKRELKKAARADGILIERRAVEIHRDHFAHVNIVVLYDNRAHRGLVLPVVLPRLSVVRCRPTIIRLGETIDMTCEVIGERPNYRTSEEASRALHEEVCSNLRWLTDEFKAGRFNELFEQ